MIRHLRVAVCLAALAAAAPVLAHHSAAAAYDMNKTVTITGIVARIEWRNPHAYFFVDVEEAPGRKSVWTLETQSPAALARVGFRKEDVRTGDRVTIDLMPAIVSPHHGRIRVFRVHGRTFDFLTP